MGVLPALLVLYIRIHVRESPAWEQMHARRESIFGALRDQWRLAIYVVVLMTAFNFLSHGTQDLYPTFLQVQHHFSTHTVGIIAVIYNVGTIAGGIFFGALSESFGRRNSIILAAILVLPVIPLWAFSTGAVLLAVGAFLLQFMVQGARGIVPVHLNELSPPAARGTFPRFTYRLGNLFASANATIQAQIAATHGGDYGLALAIIAGCVAIAVAVITWFGREAKGVAFVTRLSTLQP